jgi:hypothetical protein
MDFMKDIRWRLGLAINSGHGIVPKNFVELF